MTTAREGRNYRDIGRLLRTGLLVLAIALQGYLAQVHHHDFAAATVAAAAGGTSSDSPVFPVDDNGRDDHCFICHLSSLGATTVVAPSIAFTAIPVSLVVYRVGHDPLAVRDAPAAYASRAPPSLVVPA